MYNSNIFNGSNSDFGGWGDPTNDYQITTGGFKDVIRAYPNPHHIRRNFTLLPFRDPAAGLPFVGDPSAPPPPADLMINTTMTQQNVDFIVNNFPGDFMGFQAYFESPQVSSALPLLVVRFGWLILGRIGYSCGCPHNCLWVSAL